MRFPTFTILAFATLLVGCASPLPRPNALPKNSRAHWKKGEFTIVFQAGPVSHGDEKVGGRMRSYSSYEISRQFPDFSNPTSVAVESAQGIGHFQWNPKSRPADYVKVFTSTSGLTLLIAEDIPNDCSPCTNYILVRIEKEESGLKYDYLSFPEPPSGLATLGMPTSEGPEIVKLTDTDLTYRYGDGKLRTQTFKALLKREQIPTFPG